MNGLQALEEGLAGGDRAGAGARLDVGGALPGAADALVVVLGRLGGDADRRHRGVGAEPQVDAEDVAFGSVISERSFTSPWVTRMKPRRRSA